mgnify:CR=1 FL=1
MNPRLLYTQLIDQRVHIFTRASDEHVDALFAEQNRALEPAFLAQGQQPRAQILQAGERRELVAGDVRDRVGGGHVRWKKHMKPRTASANGNTSCVMSVVADTSARAGKRR